MASVDIKPEETKAAREAHFWDLHDRFHEETYTGWDWTWWRLAKAKVEAQRGDISYEFGVKYVCLGGRWWWRKGEQK